MKMQTLSPEPSSSAQPESQKLPPKLERILVPTDFSPLSRLAIDAALSLVERNLGGNSNASIELIHVIEPLSVAGAADFSVPAHFIPEVAAGRAQDEMESLKAVYQSRRDIATHVATGHPARTICTMAREAGVDLIVLSSHGRTGMGRMLMGSVAEQIIQDSTCPVLVIKPLKDAQGEFLPESEELVLDHILVGYDHRPGANRALAMAERIANQTHGRLALIHALPSPDLRLAVNLLRNEETEASLHNEAMKELGDVRLAHLPNSAKWELRAVVGHPWDVIADYARDHSCDLVVVGPHEHTRWGHGFMGSTAQRVVRFAPCAVLAVK